MDCFWTLTASRLLVAHRGNEFFSELKSCDFDVRNEERGIPPKKFEDEEFQALLDENDGQMQ